MMVVAVVVVIVMLLVMVIAFCQSDLLFLFSYLKFLSLSLLLSHLLSFSFSVSVFVSLSLCLSLCLSLSLVPTLFSNSQSFPPLICINFILVGIFSFFAKIECFY